MRRLPAALAQRSRPCARAKLPASCVDGHALELRPVAGPRVRKHVQSVEVQLRLCDARQRRSQRVWGQVHTRRGLERLGCASERRDTRQRLATEQASTWCESKAPLRNTPAES